MNTKSCICLLFILSMIVSLFGRPAPQFSQFIPGVGGCSFAGQVSSFGGQVPQLQVTSTQLVENNFSQAFNEYRKNCTSSVFQFGK